MKCPTCKKKDLTVARTYAEGTRTVRDRHCPKCCKYHRTIELYDNELTRMHDEQAEIILNKELEIRALRDKLGELSGAVTTIFSVIKPTESPSTPRPQKR